MSHQLFAAFCELPPWSWRVAIDEAHNRKKNVDDAWIVFRLRNATKFIVHLPGVTLFQIWWYVDAQEMQILRSRWADVGEIVECANGISFHFFRIHFLFTAMLENSPRVAPHSKPRRFHSRQAADCDQANSKIGNFIACRRVCLGNRIGRQVISFSVPVRILLPLLPIFAAVRYKRTSPFLRAGRSVRWSRGLKMSENYGPVAQSVRAGDLIGMA